MVLITAVAYVTGFVTGYKNASESITTKLKAVMSTKKSGAHIDKND